VIQHRVSAFGNVSIVGVYRVCTLVGQLGIIGVSGIPTRTDYFGHAHFISLLIQWVKAREYRKRMKQASRPRLCARFLKMPVTVEFLIHLPGRSACQRVLPGIDDTFAAELIQHSRKTDGVNQFPTRPPEAFSVTVLRTSFLHGFEQLVNGLLESSPRMKLSVEHDGYGHDSNDQKRPIPDRHLS
jgi:hypothetical protein